MVEAKVVLGSLFSIWISGDADGSCCSFFSFSRISNSQVSLFYNSHKHNHVKIMVFRNTLKLINDLNSNPRSITITLCYGFFVSFLSQSAKVILFVL